MKRKLYLLAGGIMLMLMAVAFIACEKKNKGVNGDGYSIVGTWVMDNSYYGERTTIRFNANNTGTLITKYTYEGQTYNITYNIRYNYNETTCQGSILMEIPGYSSYEYDFKLKWYGEDTFVVYLDYGYGEWETMGTFERQ